MPNIALTKADGLVLNLPAGSITAVLSTSLNPPTEGEVTMMRSVIISQFKGISTIALSHTARDVMDQIEAGLDEGTGREWIVMSAGDEDITALESASVEGYEAIKKDRDSEETILLVSFFKHNGERAHQIVNDTPENREALNELLKQRE